jgi:hypothetical protein
MRKTKLRKDEKYNILSGKITRPKPIKKEN